ncbi:leucine rich repeat domain-containing protein [Sodiomyces alkalinus F11]|uniref:Leucine rich repeat domain-containing protein n=1 Tax=Sodiomyces alkalinus (strain CBS 110278 / VKM F-3762 / F11) TaxID=1314773 RepID=A0A3N2Q6T1_SODAK|nr:leucine rich repeat domain-containing protein [Sodiomyces alkalinus F11]ROT42474.1 leucine rich repeat domain-containing protein [Sodiomyces alkalinus F11]
MRPTPTSQVHGPSSTDHGLEIHYPQPKYKMDSPEFLGRSATPEKNGRSSFSSIREDSCGPAQAFTSSAVSTLLQDFENAVAIVADDSPDTTRSHSPQTPDMTTEVQFVPPVTKPSSKLHGNWFPANNFRGWKQINVKGKTASRSFGDLQALHMAWSTPPAAAPKGKNRTPPGQAPIEKLPLELLGAIIELLVLDVPPINGITRRNMDLMSLLLTSRTMHGATLNALYRNITVPHSRIFRKFLANIANHPALGTIIRRMDFSHFNNATLFESASQRKTTKNLTSETLLQCLELTPHLQEFLAMEHIDDDLGPEVLKKLVMGLPRLQALDFAGCTSFAFRTSFTSLLGLPWPDTLSITRLSFHKCLTLPSSIFETIFPRLAQVTHLDLAQTRVTDKALESIPHTARLTHLNLAKCTLLTAPNVINFFATHPAVKYTLVYLSVAADARSHQLLGEDDVSALIPLLPETLRSLSLKGSKMTDSHLKLLRPLTKHLEELSVGRNMDVLAASQLLCPANTGETNAKEGGDEEEEKEGKKGEEPEEEGPSTVRFLDLSDLWGNELNLTHLFSKKCCLLLQDQSRPLEVIEVSETAFKSLSRSLTLERVGWSLREIGSRYWIVRLDKGNDRGHRWWKMGADHWGMRKIPVARSEVGGMYGSFMFGRKL